MQLINRDDYGTVLRFTENNLPGGMIIHLWLKLQVDILTSSSFKTFLFADIWPNPNILCILDYHRNGSTILFLWCQNCQDDEHVLKFLRELDQNMNIINTEYLYCILPEYHRKVMEKFVDNRRKIKVSYDYQFWIPHNKRKMLLENEIPSPEGYYFDILKLDEAKFVDDHWSHQFPGSLERMKCWIEYMPSVALRVNGTGELASFELVSDEHGMMTHLYTVKEHRRRGLAMKVEEKLAQLLISRNIIPFKNVVTENVIGIAMTDKSPLWNNLGYLAAYIHIY